MTNRSDSWLEAVNRLKPKKQKLTGGNALFSSTPTYLSILQMSYAPGTLLSIGAGATLEQVLVLSDGRVATKLFAGKPVVQRDILSLSDWLLLTDGQNITIGNVQTPLPASPVATPVVTPVPEPLETYPMGTRLRWSKDDNKNRRTAIVIKDGVLQVKEVIDNNITMIHDKPEAYYKSVKKTFFNNVAEWRASLPEGGTVATFSGPQVASIEEKAKKPITATSDAGYIKELSKRYSVDASFHSKHSLRHRIEECHARLKGEINKYSELANNGKDTWEWKMRTAREIYYSSVAMNGLVREAYGKTPTELNAVTYRFINTYRQKLFAYKDGLKYEIASNGELLGLCPRTEGTGYWGNVSVAKTFAELGVDMKSDGKPRLEVSYRRRRIEL